MSVVSLKERIIFFFLRFGLERKAIEFVLKLRATEKTVKSLSYTVTGCSEKDDWVGERLQKILPRFSGTTKLKQTLSERLSNFSLKKAQHAKRKDKQERLTSFCCFLASSEAI